MNEIAMELAQQIERLVEAKVREEMRKHLGNDVLMTGDDVRAMIEEIAISRDDVYDIVGDEVRDLLNSARIEL